MELLKIEWAEHFNIPYQNIYYWRKTNQIDKRFLNLTITQI